MQFFATALFAQESIVATPEKTSILLGEPLTITITITGGQPYKAAILDSLGRFEVLERKPAATKTKDGTVTTTEQIVVTSFDSGTQRIPPIIVQGNAAVVSPGVDITVNTLPADAKVEYGDIKQIIDLKPPNQLPYIIALSLLALISLFFIYRLNKKYKVAEGVASVPTEIVSPNSLLHQLENVRARWAQQQITSMELGNQLMEVLRTFLRGRGINSTSKTGEELVLATKQMYDPNTWRQVVQTIRLCNAMRFGKYQAGLTEGTEGINAFIEAITVREFQPGNYSREPATLKHQT